MGRKRNAYGVKKPSKRFKGEGWRERLASETEAAYESTQVSLNPQDQAVRESVPGPSTVVPESGSVGGTDSEASGSLVWQGPEPVHDPLPASLKKFSWVMTVTKSKAHKISGEDCLGEGNRIVSLRALSEFAAIMKCPLCTPSLGVSEGVGAGGG
ncbi:MAG: hypothetical protein A6F71_09360 [Cycloclasticus sp. symbiont of Poecilosclerida sp. M]|nr:MAG: hypothetical protein A6F71_09360 [Cycloclasticus sp. symbiont of Poecilosclerida sp. M]